MKVREILAVGPVMPVIVVDEVGAALNLAAALLAGGVRVLEVTLRTPGALACISAVRRAHADAIVGAGTVTNAHELRAAIDAGAQFGVSPGTSRTVLEAAREAHFPFLPGIMTPTDLMAALEAGYDTVKLFPAELAGGRAFLKALQGPFANAMFCPTGGIDAAAAPAYLALSNVACVGGSWLAPVDLVAASDWAAITARARTAAALARAWSGAQTPQPPL